MKMRHQSNSNSNKRKERRNDDHVFFHSTIGQTAKVLHHSVCYLLHRIVIVIQMVTSSTEREPFQQSRIAFTLIEGIY